jgi:hypothetical protein
MVVNFAYGSNMLMPRIAARVPSARPLGAALLHGHGRRWHKVGRDGSGKCDVVPDATPGQVVHGVLYRIDAREMPRLDAAEGLGQGYDAVELEVEWAGGRRLAHLYRATHIDPSLRPFRWYRELVVAGAVSHRLPADVVAALRAVPAIEDPDEARARAHFALAATG